MSRPDVKWPLVAACSALMICEGFDLVVYGNIIPLLLADGGMGIGSSTAGNVGSLAFLGMLFGGVSSGWANRLLPQRAVIGLGTGCFSAAVLATAACGDVLAMGVLRFVTGLGLGVVLPTALSAARKGVRTESAPLVVSVVMAGIPVGGSLASAAVSTFGEAAGWRAPLAAAGLVGFAVLAVSFKALPAGRQAKASGRGASAAVRDVLRGSRKWLILFFCLATFADLASYYGVTTWLTQLMREFDLPMGSSLQLTLALNVGAIGGSLASSLVAARVGAKRVAIPCGLLAAACLTGVAARPGSPIVLALLVIGIGAFAISAQNLLNTVVSDSFPEDLRSTALGLTLGVGRLGAVAAPAVGGAVLELGLGAETVLACFAAASLLGCAALMGGTRRRVDESLGEQAAVRCGEAS